MLRTFMYLAGSSYSYGEPQSSGDLLTEVGTQ